MASDTVLVELPAEEANWVRDAVAQKRDALPEDSEHYQPEEIDGLLANAEDRLNAAIEGWSAEEGLTALLDRGLSPAEAVDYYMVERRGLSQSAWARRRDIGQQSVSENVNKAKAKLGE